MSLPTPHPHPAPRVCCKFNIVDGVPFIGTVQQWGTMDAETKVHSAESRRCRPFCFTSTEARWLIRDGDRGERKSEGSTAGYRPKKKRSTLRASLSGTFLQNLPDLVTPLKGHSLFPRSCPATRSAPSGRFLY